MRESKPQLNKHQGRWLQIVLSLALCLALLLGPATAVAEDAANTYTELDEAMDLLKTFHLSGMTEEEMIQAAIEGILYELDDPYTDHFTAEEMQAFTDSLNNQYEGTGLFIRETDDSFIISNVFEGTSAQNEGLQEGDVVTAVNGQSTKGKSIYDLEDAEFGEQGGSVKVTVERDGKPVEVSLSYENVQVPVVEGKWLGDGIGYLALRTFTQESADAFAEELEHFAEQGLEALVVDLRYNGGGLIESAQQIGGHFYSEGAIAYLRDRDKKEKVIHVFPDQTPVTVPLVILVNEDTASASEVLAGALQDKELGVIIGSQTYGKGVVQNLYPLLSSGGVLKITVQEYYTPKRNQVHNKGITPDIVVTGNHEQLFKAFHTLGIKHLGIELHQSKIKVNGQDFFGDIDVIKKDKKTHLPARFLASIINADLTWDAKSKSVQIKTSDTTKKYPLQSLLVKEGTSYIDVSVFGSDFPEFKWNHLEARPYMDVNLK
jgi:carboxyl-terminal processing protease